MLEMNEDEQSINKIDFLNNNKILDEPGFDV